MNQKSQKAPQMLLLGSTKWDWAFKISASLILFLVAVRSLAVLVLYFGPTANPWVIGDWLIDYAGGFVRRGLTGEFISLVGRIFNLDTLIITATLQSLLFVFVVCMTVVLFQPSKNEIAAWLMLLSPATGLFYIDVDGAFRKELILFATFSSFLVISRGQNRNGLVPLLFIFTAFPLVLLSHEGMYFYLPIVLIGLSLFFTELRISRVKKVVLLASFTLVSTLFLFISMLNRGSYVIALNICLEKQSRGLPQNVCNGAINFLAIDFEDIFALITSSVLNSRYFSTYLLAIILSLAGFSLVSLKNKLLIKICLSALFTLPLYVVATDWGRWIHIYFLMLTLLILRFSNTSEISYSKLPQTVSVHPGAFTLFCLFFVSSWNIPHSGGGGLGGGLIEAVLSLYLDLKQVVDIFF